MELRSVLDGYQRCAFQVDRLVSEMKVRSIDPLEPNRFMQAEEDDGDDEDESEDEGEDAKIS